MFVPEKLYNCVFGLTPYCEYSVLEQKGGCGAVQLCTKFAKYSSSAAKFCFFVSLLEDPPARLDMSLKNFCFFVFLSKNPPTRPRYVFKKLLFFCLSV